jgi:quercetin dioxygenase-like cupin family protein
MTSDMHGHLAQAGQPQVVRGDEAEALWWFDSLAIIKATADTTAGQVSIIDVTEPPNAETPLHVHHREDEGFLILEGDATFEIGSLTIEARAGDYLLGPRGIPHRFTVGSSGCRMLFILTPGGFEAVVRAMSRPAEARVLPPPSDVEPDWEAIAAVAQAHGAELLG